MSIEICTLGGYNEVGKNSTAIKIDDEVIICDMGIHLEPYIRYTEEREDIYKISAAELVKVGAIPDISKIEKWRNKTIAIIPTHAHLDHIGAIPFLSKKFNCPIICTPFTKSVLTAILKDEKISLKNSIKTLNAGSTIKLSKNITIEFINVTHSTPQTIILAIHTKHGTILYANDFKFDKYPTLGQKPDFKRLQEIGNQGVNTLIVDSTYSRDAKKMPSESVAKEMLRDVLLGTDSRGKAVIVSTFSSQIARLKSILNFGIKMNREVVFLGRSLAKYIHAAEDINLVHFSDQAEICKFSGQVKKKLKKIMQRGKEKYLLIVTGHQGEPRSILSRMANHKLPFKFDEGDHVVFSCTIIPTPINKENREILESQLKQKHVRIFKDIHASGHAAREDLRDMINFVKPKYLLPAHGEPEMISALADLATEMGYKKNQILLMQDGNITKVE